MKELNSCKTAISIFKSILPEMNYFTGVFQRFWARFPPGKFTEHFSYGSCFTGR